MILLTKEARMRILPDKSKALLGITDQGAIREWPCKGLWIHRERFPEESIPL